MSTKLENLKKIIVVGATLRLTELQQGELKDLRSAETDRPLLVSAVDEEGFTVIQAEPKGTHELGDIRIKWPENDDMFTAGRENFSMSEVIDKQGTLKIRKYKVEAPDPAVYTPQGPQSVEPKPADNGGPADVAASAPTSPTAPAVTVEPGTETEKENDAAKGQKKS